ncbi:CDC27 family protein [Sulfuricurvum sp.]|uniref:tetratricopeptide repeat protein n=1 Tax=Sulfuricurvum sp. TaxID=2025608 RepID=UPI002612F945|nr:CDC27 family protein [Sulfuricurvum sp.]MDD2780153.1 CDC27 family protein [Sulfuricurvum sp.]
MLDIKKLERRWLKYKIKSFAPYFMVFFLLLLVLSGVSWWFKSQISTQTSITKVPMTSTLKAVSDKSLPLTIDENTTILEPSMDFIQSFQDAPVPNEIQTSPTSIKKIPTPQLPPIPKNLKIPEYSPSQTVPVASRLLGDDKSLSIKRDDTKLDINELQRRFKETSNANLALFISRYYYDHGDYNEAYNYALKTNNLNNRIDESWILFSKSLVKLGKTDQAKKTLQLYISQSNSDAAKNLLDNIERGNFK